MSHAASRTPTNLRDTLARVVIPLGGARRQRVRAAMRIRVVARVVLRHRVEHGARLLRRRGGVEVVQLGKRSRGAGSPIASTSACRSPLAVRGSPRHSPFAARRCRHAPSVSAGPSARSSARDFAGAAGECGVERVPREARAFHAHGKPRDTGKRAQRAEGALLVLRQLAAHQIDENARRAPPLRRSACLSPPRS